MLAGGHIVSGGSTLTMQVARLLEGAPTRDASAKLRQIVRARQLEASLTKDEILTLYLTLAPYGGNIEGVRAASLAYFGKEPTRLTLAEAALLVALPQSPEARRPARARVGGGAARDRVLDRVAAAGLITAEAAAAAKTEKVPTARRLFPMLAAHLGQQAVAAHPDAPVITLTLDRDLQAALEQLARERVAAMGPKLSVAIVVADHRSGEILASVGSADLLDEKRAGFVDMTRAVRSPGSTLKPLVYGLAFEEGLAHPESLIEDRPTGFDGYAPQNFDGYFRGTVTMREALTQSLNIPAIIVLDAVGPARLVARLKRAEIAPILPDLSAPGLAVGLGGVGVTPRDLVQLYAAIARGGAPVMLRDGIADPPAVAPEATAPVLAPTAAWYVADILADTPPPSNAAPRLFDAFTRLGPQRVPRAWPPAGALIATTAALPAPLRRFRHPDETVVERDTSPEIAFPQDGVAVDLGIRAGDPAPLVIKVRNGAPPFTFFANGMPIGREPFDRAETWMPDGPGFVTLSVVDSSGRADRVTVFVE